MSTYTVVMKLVKLGSEVSHFDYRSRRYSIHHTISRTEITTYFRFSIPWARADADERNQIVSHFFQWVWKGIFPDESDSDSGKVLFVSENSNIFIVHNNCWTFSNIVWSNKLCQNMVATRSLFSARHQKQDPKKNWGSWWHVWSLETTLKYM
jgi:hypothetical protein